MSLGKLKDIITQVAEPKQENPTCPYCTSSNIEALRSSQTMLRFEGAKGGKKDSNHYTKECQCHSCQEKFTWEYKNGMQWYMDLNEKVIKGIHNCFEKAIYTCKKCSSNVERTYTNLDGVTKTNALQVKYVEGKAVYQYRVFWKCISCPNEVEVKAS